MKKIVFGILAIFMTLSLAYGSCYLIENSISTSTTEETETDDANDDEISAKTSGNWYDTMEVYGNNLFDRFGGRTETKNGRLYATIPSGLTDENAAYAFAGFMRCVSTWSNWQSVDITIERDIDLSAHYWTPIGNLDRPFTGSFHGNGHKITGVYIRNSVYSSRNDDLSVAGLFGATDRNSSGGASASLNDFTVSGNIVLSTTSDYSVCVGGVIGQAEDNTTLINVNVENFNINVNFAAGDYTYIGGIVGRMFDNSWLENCNNYESNIEITFDHKNNTWSYYYIGGIIGEGFSIGGSAISCYSTCNISVKSKKDPTLYYIGGIIGYCSDSFYLSSNTFLGTIDIAKNILPPPLTSVKNMGFVLLDTDSTRAGFAGGIVGRAYNIRIDDCYNYGSINALSKAVLGGIGAWGTGVTVSNCGNFANITKEDSTGSVTNAFGGIFGRLGLFRSDTSNINNIIQDCVNYGDIIGVSSNNKPYDFDFNGLGGIVGYSAKAIVNRCVNYGQISSGGLYVGGIVGYNYDGVICNCINYGQTRGYASDSYGQIIGKNNELDYVNYRSTSGGCNTGSFFVVGSSLSTLSYLCNPNRSWETPTINGVKYTGFSRSIIKDTFYYNKNDYWIMTPVVKEYYTESEVNSKGFYKDYSLVPMTALGYGYIELYWQKGTDGDKTKFYCDEDEPSNIANVYSDKLFVEENLEYITSETLSKNQRTQSFCYLRGVDYSKHGKGGTLKIKLMQPNNFSLASSSQGYEILSNEEISNRVIGNYIYPNFRSVPNVISTHGGSSSSFETLYLTYTFKSEKVSSDIYSLYYLGTKDGLTVKNATLGSSTDYGALTFKSKPSQVYYNDTLEFTITPNLGYKVLGIYKGIDIHFETDISTGEQKLVTNLVSPIYENSNDSLGVIEGSYKFNFETSICVAFEYVGYTIDIIREKEKPIPEDEYPEYKNMKLQGQERNLLSTLGGSSGLTTKLGYKYTVYYIGTGLVEKADEFRNFDLVPGKTYSVIGTYEKYNSNENIVMTVEDVFSHLTSAEKNALLGKNEFTIYISCESIAYEINLKEMANNFKSTNIYLQNDSGGTATFSLDKMSSGETGSESGTTSGTAANDVKTAIFTIDGRDVDGKKSYSKISISAAAKTIYKYIGFGYSDNADLSGDKSGNDAVKLNGKEMTFSEFLDGFVKKAGTKEKLTLKGNNGIFSGDLYFYFGLETFNFYGGISLDGVILSDFPNVDNEPIDILSNLYTLKTETTESGGSPSDTVHPAKTAQNLYYSSPITLSAEDANGYKFVGFYLGTTTKNDDNSVTITAAGKLLTNKNQYIICNSDPTNLFEIAVVAKFVSYKTLEKHAIDVDKNVYYIRNVDDLVWLSQEVEKGNSFEGCIFEQTTNLNLSGISFNPIGSSKHPFKGTYNGNSYIISNFKPYNGTGGSENLSNLGLFGYTEGATIRNVTLKDGAVNAYTNVGGLVGYAKNTTFENVANYSVAVDSQKTTFYDVSGKGTNEYISSYSNPIPMVNQVPQLTLNISVFEIKENMGGLVGLAENCRFDYSSNRAHVGENSYYEDEKNNEKKIDIKNIAGLVGKATGDYYLNQCFSDVSQTFEKNILESSTDCSLPLVNVFNADGTLLNCYSRYSFDLISAISGTSNSSRTFYYNAFLQNDDGEQLYINGNYDSKQIEPLDSQYWINIGSKLVLRYFYWN